MTGKEKNSGRQEVCWKCNLRKGNWWHASGTQHRIDAERGHLRWTPSYHGGPSCVKHCDSEATTLPRGSSKWGTCDSMGDYAVTIRGIRSGTELCLPEKPLQLFPSLLKVEISSWGQRCGITGVAWSLGADEEKRMLGKIAFSSQNWKHTARIPLAGWLL